MAHHSSRTAWERLGRRLDRFPQGAPPSETLFQILKVLFSEREAALVSLLPIRPFTARTAAEIWKTSEKEARVILDALAARALLVDIEIDGAPPEEGEADEPRGPKYVLPPPMAGFFEFSLMRVRGDIDQKALAELFHQYLNVEEDFIRALFTEGETRLGRVFVQEPALSPENALEVLDWERASEVVKAASHLGVSLCYCRHKMAHLGRACDAPLEICLTLNGSAASLVRHGHARAIDVVEGLDLLQQARERDLVQFGENVRESLNFICNCCGCCCEALMAARRFATARPIHAAPFLPVVDGLRCTGCGRCVRLCPVEAMRADPAEDPARPGRRVASVSEERCLGCGICVRNCASGALSLRSRGVRILTPRDTAHRALVMALERGKLAELLFDNQILWSHRAMAAFLGAILELPPARRLLASRQLRSTYLDTLARRLV
jgi:ferredoxin